MKHYSARFIALCLLVSLLAGCGGGETPSGADTTTAAPEVTTQSVEEILGFAREDNGGKTFTMLVAETKGYEYDAEEATGDVVSDAVYAKNTAVEDYLGIDFEFLYEDGNWNNRGAFNAMISADVMSGDSTYDLVSAVTVCTVSAATEGIFMEGKSLDCDFDKPWWIADMYDRFSVAGKLYGFIGDASLSLYKDMTVVYFNKRIWDEYNQPNPYELVRNNEWTIDKMAELTAGMAADLNGDGTYDYENDQVAYLAEGVPNGTFQTSLELKVVDIDKDGIPQYLGLSEKFVNAFEKMKTFHKNPGIIIMSTIDDASYTSMKTFANNNVATMVNFIYSTEYLRDMKDDYGILPMPKYDKNQEKYVSQLGTSTSMMFVPVTTKDPALTSKVMEACCYYTGELVVPKYYEVALKEKYARDEDIAEMLDIIRDGAAFDFLFVYGAGCLTSAPNSYFRFYNYSTKTTDTTDVDIASKFASSETAFMTSLETFIDKVSKLEN